MSVDYKKKILINEDSDVIYFRKIIYDWLTVQFFFIENKIMHIQKQACVYGCMQSRRS